MLIDIEDHDESKMCATSPNIHEKTLNSFAHEWSSCDIFESNENDIKIQYVVNEEEEEEKEKDLQTEIVKQNTSTFSQNETDTHWQDNTFLNAFTQLDSYDVKDNVLECFKQVINSFNICKIICRAI